MSPSSSTGAVCHSHLGSSPKPRHKGGKHQESSSKESRQTRDKSSKGKKSKKSEAEKKEEQANDLAGVGSQFDYNSYYEADPNGYDGNPGGTYDYTYDGVYEEEIQLE